MLRLVLFLALLSTSVSALETQILNKGKVILQEDFSKAFEVKKPKWLPKQKTRWSVKDGVLLGIPSTPEYQAKKKKEGNGHTGNVPRIAVGKLPKSYIINFKFQIDDKKWTKLLPMFEFGHHVSRIYFSKDGAKLLTNHEKVTKMKDEELILQPFKWYEVLAEIGEENLHIQIKDEKGKIHKFYCHYPEYKEAENTAFQIATTVNGTVKMDDIKFWESKGLKENWQKNIKK